MQEKADNLVGGGGDTRVQILSILDEEGFGVHLFFLLFGPTCVSLNQPPLRNVTRVCPRAPLRASTLV